MFLVHQKIFTDPQASRGVVQRSLVASNFASQWPKSLPKRKKSLSDDVFAIKNCVVRRLMTPLHSKHAQGPKQVPNNLFWCSYCPRKVFARPQTKSVNFKIVIFEQFLIKFDFWRALECLKPQKSASGDVFAFKNRLKHRLMLSFASTWCHGLKQVCNNLFWCFWCIKKIFTDPQASRGVV